MFPLYKLMQTLIHIVLETHSLSHTHPSQMVLLEAQAPQPQPLTDPNSSPRISFSAEFLDDTNFISINPKERDRERQSKEAASRNIDFEFLSGDKTNMITADELFSEGKLLPFRQTLNPLHKITVKTDDSTPPESDQSSAGDDQRRISWFLDDDPSPRPPKCTVLWKELLRLKKQRSSTLSPSLSSSSSSSSEEERKKGSRDNKVASKVKKGLERTRSANIRIRPMINVPICTAARSAALPPLFPVRRGRLES